MVNKLFNKADIFNTDVIQLKTQLISQQAYLQQQLNQGSIMTIGDYAELSKLGKVVWSYKKGNLGWL